MRKIIHVDMDAFYASVEQRDDPALRGKPVAVGGASKRGVVAAASYEARTYGVRSAMPSVTAQRRCPDLIFVKPRFEVYTAVSRQIRAIFHDYTDLVEPLSLDEAYLDVTENKPGIASATQIAQEIRSRIRAETGLTASAGVSYNKFIAKLASDQNKPDGLCVIPPNRGPAFVAMLPVKRFHGVGPKTAEKMAQLGIMIGADLRDRPVDWLERHFGRFAHYLHRAAHGQDDRAVTPDRPLKSVSSEDTFFDDLNDGERLHSELARIGAHVWTRIEKRNVRGRTVNLKVKFGDFQIITRAQSLSMPVANEVQFLSIGAALLERVLPTEKGIRLLGLGLSSLEDIGTDNGPHAPLLEIQPELIF